MRAGAGARRRVIDRAGLGFRQGDDVVQRFRGKRRMRRQQIRKLRQLRHRREIAHRVVRQFGIQRRTDGER